MSNGISYHLWFMYAMIGLIIATPFLAKMLHSLKINELKILCVLGLIWNFIEVNLCNCFNINFVFSHWILSAWGMYFCGGFIITKIMLNRKLLYISGVVSYVAVVMGQYFCGADFKNANDKSIFYIIFAFAVYVLCMEKVQIKNQRMKKVLYYLSQQTFSIYLLHIVFIETGLNCYSLFSFEIKCFVLRWIISIVWVYGASLISTLLFDKLLLCFLKKL